ncbi:hypothetical protein BASA50_008976 [Batrachochytrium salamandrivorans]|uniref:C-CAP/cofactor C-like domain-containing protein n=1 Tax=Batrachochytrium salamandrivorans TaxID=1357716 RepID=A0ABQ8F2G8_9FUNG|nr:hypothetical protein BASA50_008976 [Batrachochytrium salamandrivorans]KAH6601895.1 hypothetical protein BASA61_001695 [Batrachochytrium salamandrivorans]
MISKYMWGQGCFGCFNNHSSNNVEAAHCTDGLNNEVHACGVVKIDILTQQLPCPPMKIAKTSELAVNDHAIETLQCGAKYNIADFTFSKIVASQRVKLPGSIPNGMPFTIEDCKDAQLFVMDITAQTTVDSCINTFIFIGPCEGSVFIRDCTNCTIVCAAHQLRLRGCQNIKLVLYVATQPVIETSSEIQFSCFRYAYSQLKDQFRSAKLDVLSNFWCDVFDFNDITSKNYTIVDILNNTADVTMAVPSDEPILDVDITYKTCPVPLTEHMTNDTLASVNNDNIVLIAATFLNAHNIIEEYIDIPRPKASKMPNGLVWVSDEAAIAILFKLAQGRFMAP